MRLTCDYKDWAFSAAWQATNVIESSSPNRRPQAASQRKGIVSHEQSVGEEEDERHRNYIFAVTGLVCWWAPAHVCRRLSQQRLRCVCASLDMRSEIEKRVRKSFNSKMIQRSRSARLQRLRFGAWIHVRCVCVRSEIRHKMSFFKQQKKISFIPHDRLAGRIDHSFVRVVLSCGLSTKPKAIISIFFRSPVRFVDKSLIAPLW